MAPKRRDKSPARDVAAEHVDRACALLLRHPLFAPLFYHAHVVREEGNLCPRDGWAVVTESGQIHVHPTRRAPPEEWVYVLAHCLLHLGFGHLRVQPRPREWAVACDWAVARFLAELKIGRCPEDLLCPVQSSARGEDELYRDLCDGLVPMPPRAIGAAGPQASDLLVTQPAGSAGTGQRATDWPSLLGTGLAAAVTHAVNVAGGLADETGAESERLTPYERARRWFIDSYPLLGALAASFDIVADVQICQRLGISVAAVDAESKEIFINPAAGLDAQECRFVMAHELLHVGLSHQARRQGRDPYLWNVACFPAGTWTGYGAPIEDVATMERAYHGEVIRVVSQGASVTCTPEHPFYSRRRRGSTYPIRLTDADWVEAADLRVGDYVLVPRLGTKVWDDRIDLRPYVKRGTDGRGRHTFGNHAINDIPLDEDVAWLIGLYVAEGSGPRVQFTLNADEDDLANRAITVMRRLGWSTTIQRRGSSMAVRSGAVAFGRWLRTHCGLGAHSKQIPRTILLHGDARIRAAFMRGLMDGDGHVRRNGRCSTTVWMIGSVSERLIADVALLLAQDGIGGHRGVMTRGPRSIGGRMIEKPLRLHTFRWNPAGAATTTRVMNGRTIISTNHSWRTDDEGVWYPIRVLTRTLYDGTVYNVTTDDHTYVANGLLVHNCDYVINGWLIEMGVGELPRIGVLHDPDLKGESAEAIYDRIVTDARRYRKLATLRGAGLGDILERGTPDWWAVGDGVTLDEFYRRCLGQGLAYHEGEGRGFLPAGLVEEIRALSQPPVPWDVDLARWFDAYFSPLETRRTYARPSRRQSSTPDIPRPRYVPVEGAEDGRTFGVILDTSGSMDRDLLAKALGAIVSYSLSRDVALVRVVFCDAATYDQGYMAPDALAERVKVKGRGGTVLQPAVDLLERADDFPPDGPLLIITDGYCDRLRVRREHAFLLPEGHSLPFVPRGKVFRLR